MLVCEDHRFERALDPGFVEAVQVSQQENLLCRHSLGIKTLVEYHCAARQGSRLVAAKDVHAAEVQQRGEVLDDHLPAGHVDCPLGQGDGGDHRQKLRGKTDGEGNGEEQRLERVAPQSDTDHEHEEDKKDDRLQDQEAEPPRAPVELGLRRPGCQAGRDVAEGSGPAGLQDHRGRRAAHDRRPQENQIRRTCPTRLHFRELHRLLLDRH
jgi:hypothetical protein